MGRPKEYRTRVLCERGHLTEVDYYATEEDIAKQRVECDGVYEGKPCKGLLVAWYEHTWGRHRGTKLEVKDAGVRAWVSSPTYYEPGEEGKEGSTPTENKVSEEDLAACKRELIKRLKQKREEKE